MCVVGCGYLNLSRGSTYIPPLKYGILYGTIPKMVVIVLLSVHLFYPFFLEQWDKNHVHLGVLKLTITPKVNKDSLSHLPRGSLRSFDKTKLRQSTGRCGEGRLSPLTFPLTSHLVPYKRSPASPSPGTI